MIFRLLSCLLLLLTACAPRQPAVDPRTILTPREVYLLFDLEYEDQASPRWRSLGKELDSLEGYGLLERFTVAAQPGSPGSARTMITSRGDHVVQMLGWVADFEGHPNLRSDQPPPHPIHLTLSEDLPALDGASGFYSLSKDRALAKGRSLAHQDFNRGLYRVLVTGVPDPTRTPAAELFLIKHGIVYYTVGGIAVTDGIRGVVDGYNSVMRDILKEKFHTDLLASAALAGKPVAADFDFLTPREIYLLLDIALGDRGASQWYEFVPELRILESSGLIQRHYDEEAAHQYNFPCATLTPRGLHVVYLLGVTTES